MYAIPSNSMKESTNLYLAFRARKTRRLSLAMIELPTPPITRVLSKAS